MAVGGNKVVQVGIVVKDIEATRASYSKVFGVAPPPIMVTAGRDQAQTRYMGQPSDATAKLCFFNFGQVQIELIEPDGLPSTWQDALDKHGDSVHHLAFVVDDGIQQNTQRLELEGTKLSQTGEYTGGRYAYLEAQELLGVAIELLEND
jgi:catechol 2,3-dioxygenase-like lactoylglutathione lyase family enzyme